MDTQTLRRDILKRAIQVSVNLREYFTEQFSRSDFEGANDNEITDRYNNALEFIYNELEDMGVTIADGVDTVLSNTVILSTLAFRECFDAVAFNELLSMSDQHRDAIYNLISSDAYSEGEFVTELLKVMYELNSIGVKIELMYNNSSIFVSNDRFIDHINSILVNVVPSTKGSVVDKYTTAIIKHEAKVESFARALASHVDVDIELKYSFTNYDIDLTGLSKQEMELYLDSDHPAQLNGFDTETMVEHKESHSHHFEYYKVNDAIEPSDSTMLVIIAEHFDKDLDEYDQLGRFYELTTDAGFSEELVKKFAKYVRIAYNLVGEYVH